MLGERVTATPIGPLGLPGDRGYAMPQGNLPKDPRMLRTIVQQHNHHARLYATVKRAGEIRVGDQVELLS
jgi:uncharacterized protein YcbX